MIVECVHFLGSFLKGLCTQKWTRVTPVVTHQPNEWSPLLLCLYLLSLTILFHHCLLSLQIVLWSFDWRTCLMHSKLKKKKKKSSYHHHHKVDFHITLGGNDGLKLIPVSLLFDRFNLTGSENCAVLNSAEVSRECDRIYTGYVANPPNKEESYLLVDILTWNSRKCDKCGQMPLWSEVSH